MRSFYFVALQIYITQDSAPAVRAAAKKQLFAVIAGVLIISSTYIVLKAINPNLVDLKIFTELDTRFKVLMTDAQRAELAKKDMGVLCFEMTADQKEENKKTGIFDRGLFALWDMGQVFFDSENREKELKVKSDCEKSGGKFIRKPIPNTGCPGSNNITTDDDKIAVKYYCQY